MDAFPASHSRAATSDVRRGWASVGRVSGYAAGVALLAGTLLFLLEATDLLGSGPEYHPTAAGPMQDEADFWVAYFAHQHHILWDVIARDSLFPIAFVTLIALSLAVRYTVGDDQPAAQLMTAFFLAGGVISALADLIFLGGAEYWRETGWTAHPPARMVAVGRSEQAIESLTRWPEAAGFVILAAALLCLGWLARSRPQLPSKLAPLAYLEALLLVGIAVAGVTRTDTAYNIFSLLTGAIVGPAVTIWLGRHLGRSSMAPEPRGG